MLREFHIVYNSAARFDDDIADRVKGKAADRAAASRDAIEPVRLNSTKHCEVRRLMHSSTAMAQLSAQSYVLSVKGSTTANS